LSRTQDAGKPARRVDRTDRGGEMIIGTCSLCGGPVETPDAWLGTLPAPETCKNCGAVRPQHGPVIDMQRTERRFVPTEDLGGLIEPKPATTGERYSWAYATP